MNVNESNCIWARLFAKLIGLWLAESIFRVFSDFSLYFKVYINWKCEQVFALMIWEAQSKSTINYILYVIGRSFASSSVEEAQANIVDWESSRAHLAASQVRLSLNANQIKHCVGKYWLKFYGHLLLWFCLPLAFACFSFIHKTNDWNVPQICANKSTNLQSTKLKYNNKK